MSSQNIWVFLQDVRLTGAKTNKVTDRFWSNRVLDPNNISFYQPVDIMLLKAVTVIMEDKYFHLLC